MFMTCSDKTSSVEYSLGGKWAIQKRALGFTQNFRRWGVPLLAQLVVVLLRYVKITSTTRGTRRGVYPQNGWFLDNGVVDVSWVSKLEKSFVGFFLLWIRVSMHVVPRYSCPSRALPRARVPGNNMHRDE